MIKANNAREMVKEYKAQKEAENKTKVQKFLDTECDSAIITAATNGRSECFIEIPADLRELACVINTRLTAEGYIAQTRYGSNLAILICW